MARKRHKDSFWLSYSDLMTSLFFIMLVLFVVCICKMKITNFQLNTALKEANATNEQLQQILQLETQFKELSKSSDLKYIEEKKMFVAKDFIGVEIFNPNKDVIKPEYIATVDRVGNSLQEIVQRLHEKNPNLNFQLVIEGNAAIPWEQLKENTYNADNIQMYELSYHRALALYQRWKLKGFDFRNYNTEVIIAGSGFNGINRDMEVEENNKRFVIQIIPKISRPTQFKF
jgi:hypothetical protein